MRVRDLVGLNVRAIRTDAGLRQTDVAEAMQRVGLRWQGTVVAALERGDKAIGLENLVLIAAGLTIATGMPITVTELIEGSAVVELTSTHSITAAALRSAAAGNETPQLVGVRATTLPTEAERLAAHRLGVDVPTLLNAANRLWGRSLVCERDRRLNSTSGALASMSARRGRVTRDLDQELRMEVFK